MWKRSEKIRTSICKPRFISGADGCADSEEADSHEQNGTSIPETATNQPASTIAVNHVAMDESENRVFTMSMKRLKRLAGKDILRAD